MKKLILIISLLIAFTMLKAQPPGIFSFTIVRDSMCLSDSCVTIIMSDTLPNTLWVRNFIAALGLQNYTFQNGLTEISGTVTLGGLMINSIIIDGDENYDFTFLDLNAFNVNEISDGMNFVSEGGLRLEGNGGIFISPWDTDVPQYEFEFSSGDALFQDYRSTATGIEYFADYSADFTDRSLVDKGYVDGTFVSGPGGSSGEFQYNNAGTFDGGPLSTDGTNITMTYVSPPIVSSWILDPTYSDPFYYQFTNSTQSALFRLRENRFEITASNSSQYSQFYFGTPIWGNMVLKTQVNTGAHWETRFYQPATLKPALLNRIYAGTDTTNTFFHLLDTAGFYVGFNRDPYNLAIAPQFVFDRDELKINYDALSYYNWIAGNNPRIRHNLFTPFFNGLNFEQDSIRFQIKNYLGITNKYSLELDARNYTSASDLFDLDLKNNLWTYRQRFFNNTTTGGWFMEFERSDLGGSRTWGLRLDTTGYAIEFDGSQTYDFQKDTGVIDNPIAVTGNFYQENPHWSAYRSTDLTITATQNVWYYISGLTVKDVGGDFVNYAGDSIQLPSGSYQLNGAVTLSGSNNELWEIALMKNGAPEEPSQTPYTGNSTRLVCALPVYFDSDGNDWFAVKIRNTSDNDDPTIHKASFIITTVHLP